MDEAALQTARENFGLNTLTANLITGSADCLLSGSMDLVVANINATVLLALADELIRVVRPSGTIILTGFPTYEAAAVIGVFGMRETLERDSWSCLISTLS